MRLQVAPLALLGLLAGCIANALFYVALQFGDSTGFDSSPETVGALAQSMVVTQSGSPSTQTPQSVSAYNEITARPVFFKTRSPYIPPPVAPPPAAKVSPPAPVFVDPGFKLGGITITGTRRKAFLISTSSPNGEWVEENTLFTGWTLQSVAAGAATLKKDDRTIEVRLYER